MKKQIFSFLFFVALIINVSAQATKQSAPKPDLTEQRLRSHVTYLASDKLEGRRTGERGATFAAGYVANMFSNFKLKPGYSEVSQNKSKPNFLQPFPYTSTVQLAKDGNEFHLSVADSAGPGFQTDSLASWKALSFSPSIQVPETTIVFAGFGIASDSLKYDDYAQVDVRDKIVLAFDRTPERENPSTPFLRFDARAKAKIAKDKGAKALFLISRETNLENDKLFFLKYDPTLGEAALPVIVISRANAAAILGTDEKGLAETENLANLKRNSGGDLALGFASRPQATADFKISFVKKPVEGYNVIGILEGTDPLLKSEAIIIGAHYDHLGRGGQGSLAANSTEIHHGADDNASGVAGLIELARQLSQEKKNKRTIIFIAFGGEEEGLLGSKFYVGSPVFPLAKTVAMINMDMIGRLKDTRLTIGGIGTASEWKTLVESINSKVSEPIITIGDENLKLKQKIGDALKKETFNNVRVEVKDNSVYLYGNTPPGKMANVVQLTQEIGRYPVVNYLVEGSETYTPSNKSFNLSLNEDGFGPSDHSSFYGKQIPVLFFFTGTHLDYHKPSDTADKINYPGLLQIVSYVSEIVKTIDQNPKRPSYLVAKSSGMGEGRRGFNVSLGTIPNYAESTDGLLLDGVRDDSPAARAGLKAGDKVVRLAGREVRNVSDYTVVLSDMQPDIEYSVVVVRAGEKLNLKITPVARK